MKRNPLLRLLLAIIDTGWWLAPASRRREWRRQWRADILHEWQWRTKHPRGLGDRVGLVGRAAGAWRHAFWLRLHVRSLEMITQDLRYGWRLMVRTPAVTIVAVLTLGLGIGANATVYSWVESGLRRPLPGVADPDRVVMMDGMTGTRDTIANEIRTIAEHLQIATMLQAQLAHMLGVFGALALLLAMVGLYGVIAATVAQRTPEIGMRMALGATRLDIAALVLRQSLGLTVAGVAFGLAGAFATTRLFKTLLVGVSATDGVSFAGTAALLVLVSLAASYLPARRAAVLDPTQALRQE